MDISRQALLVEQEHGALENAPESVRRTLLKGIFVELAAALQAEDTVRGHDLGALGKRCKLPLKDFDMLRALVFLHKGSAGEAREALKEELRYFPENTAAADLLAQLPESSVSLPLERFPGFAKLFPVIAPYTMVAPEHLLNLYKHAEDVCARQVQGNFVECGVAGGGSSGLLASVLKRHAKQGPQRLLYSCDSFSGMPPATEHDTHNGVNAELTGWGTGTCAAPEDSVLGLCRKLFCADMIHLVKGYFEDTLPTARHQFGPIAFLHMDGDWYSSTRAILDNLYDQLVPGAFVQVDDYGFWDGCRKAVDEFFAERGLAVQLHPIDAAGGVWFIKP